MNLKSLRGSLILLIGAAIWGSAFVAQDVAMRYIGPYTFNMLRYFIGSLSLLPLILIRNRSAVHRAMSKPEKRKDSAFQWKAGVCAGFALIIPSTLQQIGLVYTTAGKAGMITGMYIITVPLLGLFIGKRSRLNVWAAAVLGVAGMYFLCITGSFTIALGDALQLVAVVFWAIQILTIDHFAKSSDPFKLACIEFFVCGVVSCVPALIFETITFEAVRSCIPYLVYVGVFSCGIAYSLQPIGQRDTPPAVASLMMSLESVFAVLTGWLLLGDEFTKRELTGCCLMLCAVVLAQLSFPAKSGSRKKAV